MKMKDILRIDISLVFLVGKKVENSGNKSAAAALT